MLGKGQPQTMKGEHNSNIFCLDFNHSDTKVFSGGEYRLIHVQYSYFLQSQKAVTAEK